MPKISKDFLKAYGRALSNTLEEYLNSKPDYVNEARAKLSLNFMSQFNTLLLLIIKYESGLQMDRSLKEDAVSKLLLANSEHDCENGVDYSVKMLTFYQAVAENLENNPFKEYHEKLHSDVLFYRPGFIFSAIFFAILMLLRFFELQQVMKGDLSIQAFELIELAIIFSLSFFSTLYVGKNIELANSKKALADLQDFAQQEYYTLPGSEHKESVQQIKSWFECRNVFFQNLSMEEKVSEKADLLASSSKLVI